MRNRIQVEEELERQWHEEYLPKLAEGAIENPLDWYNLAGKEPIADSIEASSVETTKQLSGMPLHVLYRVFPARSQNIALVGNNPKDKTSELESGSGELYELAKLEMDPAAIADVTGPRIAKYYQNYVNHQKPLTDVILESLKETGYIDYESLGQYLQANADSLAPIFDDIYITNLMKLPTRTGSGGKQFKSNFYEDLLWDELTIASPDLVFVQGKPAWTAIRKQMKNVEYEPLDGAPDTSNVTKAHGHRYLIGNMTVIPIVHPSAWQNNARDKYAERRDILKDSIPKRLP